MTDFDPIRLEVLRNALEATAQEMGSVLKHTAFSPNIKERMDASCAIFTADAELVAQAEHVPVHLGSMLRAVKPTLERTGELDEGDVVIVNDPFVAGAHLPDITLIAPVFIDSRRIAYVASRAHHSDVGGMEPGSMPGRSIEIFQEGIIIPPVKLYRAGVLQEDIMSMTLANVRTSAERRGDLNAQLSALRVGARRMEEVADRFGADVLEAGLAAILDYTERRMRARMAELPRGSWTCEDCLDNDGSSDDPVWIRLRITIDEEKISFDFTGTSPQVAGNVNAVAPMCWSSIFYSLKLLTDASLPPNAGVLRPVEVHIPKGCFLDAQKPAAVCAGNTETTQRLADTVLRGFAQIAPDRIAAASNGTMNLIGIGGIDPRNGRPYTYIETSGGGQGGRPMGPGMSGVHANMSNTLNTPIESLEISYPLRCVRYELRDGSGGAGENPGGDGLIRSIQVIGHDARVSLQTDRRAFAPYGLHGGADGMRGINWSTDADGNRQDRPAKGSLTLKDKEAVTLETPGGGGWGAGV
ncbi:hydantoinase B/oxoprolinase family protein [Salipiger bermudensis]|uniref:N-methylhydantoinase B n=1 Tax=Salipiger bermudensis (strain DSM 26914 / JCM 13377 / KCTC 12554 / HTCC2601) TaxID=314265 RepID=Q0FKQ1_SALBH|nr:hydantoinase B/oxoprolinase family protein [Salipiger bermudensis]EAU44761.1 N-methylhydantoinase B [Salipiger bermudensis HTCC2601]MCA1288262.1 hydantoinase B/oxoprolinase family protein [Salipiger bermudensis]